MYWEPNTQRFGTDADQRAREEHLRRRIQELNRQIDDVGRTLRIPHRELMECVAYLHALRQRSELVAQSS